MSWFFGRAKNSPAASARNPFPRGIKCLHSPDTATVDIVLVHGQTDDREQTWTAIGEAKPWPVALLSPRFPTARILTYGYELPCSEASGFVKLLGANGMTELANNLLVSLGSHREDDDTNERPIIFICHSFGGVVCKQAMVMAKDIKEPHLQGLLDQIHGIIFLGTPTTKDSLVGWALLTMEMIGIKQIPSETFETLQMTTRMFSVDGFHAMRKARERNGKNTIEVACFYEELPTPSGLIVSSARDTLPECIAVGIRKTHSDIGKFKNNDDAGFTLVCSHLNRWMKTINKGQASHETDVVDSPSMLQTTGSPISALAKVDHLDPIEPTPPASRNGFEIAIFCALPIEADAVVALFDHVWDSEHVYKKTLGDPNAYSTGSIGRHNVVLIHMPDMGKVNAASAVASCRFSFPNVKLTLVVGVCGAVPRIPQTNEDIFLGDVILSKGVVQYDFGRQLPEGFIRKDASMDSLPRPNIELRALLNKLQGNHYQNELQGRMANHLTKLQETPKLHASYPGAASDRAFHSTYRHLSDGQTCAECRCDDNFALRSRSDVDTTIPATHIGLIASGDTVMKSAEARDNIAKREGVIGFEMEGAGTWEAFPCIIIKGVCDYADSHKTKLWQRYAAATAAACAKAFLEYWGSSTIN